MCWRRVIHPLPTVYVALGRWLRLRSFTGPRIRFSGLAGMAVNLRHPNRVVAGCRHGPAAWLQSWQGRLGCSESADAAAWGVRPRGREVVGAEGRLRSPSFHGRVRPPILDDFRAGDALTTTLCLVTADVCAAVERVHIAMRIRRGTARLGPGWCRRGGRGETAGERAAAATRRGTAASWTAVRWRGRARVASRCSV